MRVLLLNQRNKEALTSRKSTIFSILLFLMFLQFCSPPHDEKIEIEFVRIHYSGKRSQLLCSTYVKSARRQDDHLLEILIPKVAIDSCLKSIQPWLGGGIDYAILKKDGVQDIMVLAKAPFSSYAKDLYPATTPRFLPFKSQKGQLTNDNTLIIDFGGKEIPPYFGSVLSN